jgi:hypothetical protein
MSLSAIAAIAGAVSALAALALKLVGIWRENKTANQPAEQEKERHAAYQTRLENASNAMQGDAVAADAVAADIDRLRERQRHRVRERQQRSGAGNGG